MRPEAASFAKREKMEKIINTLSVLLRKSFMPENPPPSLPGHGVLRTEKYIPSSCFSCRCRRHGIPNAFLLPFLLYYMGLNVRIA
jgi:hypothetical protein